MLWNLRKNCCFSVSQNSHFLPIKSINTNQYLWINTRLGYPQWLGPSPMSSMPIWLVDLPCFKTLQATFHPQTLYIYAIGVDDIWWLLEFIHIRFKILICHITIHCRWVKSRRSLASREVQNPRDRISHVIPFHRGKFSSSSWNGSIRFYKSISPVFQWWGPSNAKKSTMAGSSQQSILFKTSQQMSLFQAGYQLPHEFSWGFSHGFLDFQTTAAAATTAPFSSGHFPCDDPPRFRLCLHRDDHSETAACFALGRSEIQAFTVHFLTTIDRHSTIN